MPTNNRGTPMPWMDWMSFQSGWAMMPTRRPMFSKTRPIIAEPNDGWSTYASPVMMSTSSSDHPLAVISSRVIGRKPLSEIWEPRALLGVTAISAQAKPTAARMATNRRPNWSDSKPILKGSRRGRSHLFAQKGAVSPIFEWRSCRAGARDEGLEGRRGIGPALAGNVGASWAFARPREGDQDVDVPMLAQARSRCRFVKAQEGSG